MNTIEDASYVNLDIYSKKVEGKKTHDQTNSNASKNQSNEDRVDLSNGADAFLKAQKTMDSLPDIRENRVASIKKMIASGDYGIQSRGTASRMIRESLLNEKIGSGV